MTDKDREILRKWFDAGVRMAEVGLREVFLHGQFGFNYETGLLHIEGRADDVLPPLTPDKVLAMSVLLGEPATLPQALADYLIDIGHDATVAAREIGERQERERVDYAITAMLVANHDGRYIRERLGNLLELIRRGWQAEPTTEG